MSRPSDTSSGSTFCASRDIPRAVRSRTRCENAGTPQEAQWSPRQCSLNSEPRSSSSAQSVPMRLGDAAIAELQARGIRVHAARRSAPTREVITLLDGGGERTILTVGERLQPHGDDDLDWGRLEHADGVYLTAGDPAAVRVLAGGAGTRRDSARGRAARRSEPDDRRAGVQCRRPGRVPLGWTACRPTADCWWRPRAVAAGAGGASRRGPGMRCRRPARSSDSYGCGDAFAAGLTFGLAQGLAPSAVCRDRRALRRADAGVGGRAVNH